MDKTITVQDLKTLLDKAASISLIDVRRKKDYDSEPQMIPGALWRDPEQVDDWRGELSQSKNVIVYCVKGGSVSKSTAHRLREKGLNVRYIEGGLAAWKDFGGANS
jgi:rhodanese-related sulfurtransferase